MRYVRKRLVRGSAIVRCPGLLRAEDRLGWRTLRILWIGAVALAVFGAAVVAITGLAWIDDVELAHVLTTLKGGVDAQAATLTIDTLGLDADVGFGDGDGDWLLGPTRNGERAVVERAAPGTTIFRLVDVDENRLCLLRLVVKTGVGRVDEVEGHFTDLTIALEADAGLEGVTGGNLDWVLDDLHGVLVVVVVFLRALVRL